MAQWGINVTPRAWVIDQNHTGDGHAAHNIEGKQPLGRSVWLEGLGGMHVYDVNLVEIFILL